MQIANEAILRDLISTQIELANAFQKHSLALASFLASLEDEEWVSSTKASKLTGLSPRQLRYRAANGDIRTKQNGRNILFFSTDLVSYRNSNIA